MFQLQAYTSTESNLMQHILSSFNFVHRRAIIVMYLPKQSYQHFTLHRTASCQSPEKQTAPLGHC